MKTSRPRSRRHRNPEQGEQQKKPFFQKQSVEKQADNSARTPFFQAKSKMGNPGDAYEKEADQVADAVTLGKQTRTQGKTGPQADVQRYMTNAKEDEMGTNTQRMEKDKAIQEKPGLQKMEEVESIQPKGEEEEESLQMMEEEEPQAQEDEEEESLQSKGEEEEESLQTMEEEEPQAQEDEEEEALQSKGGEEEESLQMMEEEEPQAQEEEEAMQTKPAPGSGKNNRKATVKKKLNRNKGNGRPLPKAVKAKMEQAIGADFSEVRIHTDREATAMNKNINAQAFAFGRDIYFNNGKYRPETQHGLHLLAHELAHVVQQGKAPAKKKNDS
ncbi:eCIS core domain-containing protein [Flavilitoribacter nigricans]|uniref:eCIS core domain-containing protein n=1 Tax=Flavilitoribacter nigricans (strain ATCC 23147 / DSM 23189 / NBRC 102662 / NCIMB 1420 / SS-2) TaxID=1122177 RepID=A0A2D0NCW7_FLAN2|nr:DUF4157 domain-containing protein [Flavilitoribacter nigricans]PHN06354.1 hypothetical protein CRP01_12350 [Flavilitoribacter nigricans DSM 23189 = NBRC 102662]